MYSFFIKRILDILFSFLLLILTIPIHIIIIALLYILNNGQVFFIQKRPGKKEKIFSIIKYKTMNDRKDEHGNLLPDINRITPIGKFIRNTSIDELPQLINVLIGDLSLIGPRPLLVEYLPFYNEFQKKRHNVRPGITGWAQVNGRNGLSWEDKFELDVWYVEHISFKLDMKIILLTIWNVISGRNVNSSNTNTMEKFQRV